MNARRVLQQLRRPRPLVRAVAEIVNAANGITPPHP